MIANQLQRTLDGYANVGVNDFSIDIDRIQSGIIFLTVPGVLRLFNCKAY